MEGDELSQVFSFEGKRNCCFTLVIGDCPDATKQLDSVERKVPREEEEEGPLL